jgi:hypothetical protein
MEGDIRAPMYRRIVEVGAWSKERDIAATGEGFAGCHLTKANTRLYALLLQTIDDLLLDDWEPNGQGNSSCDHGVCRVGYLEFC